MDPLLLKPDRSPAPYLVAFTAQAVVALVGIVVSEFKRLGFGSSDLPGYRAWVYQPELIAWLIVLLVALVGMLVVALPMPRKARLVAVLIGVTIGLVVSGVGLHESIERRHLGRAMEHAMATVRVVGATPVGAVVDNSRLVLEGEPVHLPGRAQTWRLPGNGRATACAAITASTPADKGWTTNGDCMYSRHVGRVIVQLEPTLEEGDNWSVVVSALPSYF